MGSDEWHERHVLMDIQKEKEARMLAEHVNQFDGLVHASNGKIYDPQDGSEVKKWMQDTAEVQTKYTDVFDENFEIDKHLHKVKKQHKVNRWDGLIHAKNGKRYDPETMKEVQDLDDEEAVQYDASGVVIQYI